MRKEKISVKKKKNKSKESGDEVLTTKTKSQLTREARKNIPLVRVKEVPYPLVNARDYTV